MTDTEKKNIIITMFLADAKQYEAAYGKLDADFYKSWIEGGSYFDDIVNPRVIGALDGFGADWLPIDDNEPDNNYTVPGQWIELYEGGFDDQRAAFDEALSFICAEYDNLPGY